MSHAPLSMNARAEIPCRLDVPEPFRVPARYAVSMLLYPLGLTPKFSSDPAGELFYYGTRPEQSNAPLRVRCTQQTLAYFSLLKPFDPAGIGRIRIGDEDVPTLFPQPDEDVPFDLVAASFFWLSGWEEWITRERDRHGRFPFSASLLSHFEAVDMPPVDHYREYLAQRLSNAGVSFRRRSWGTKLWAFIPTIDVDALYKYRPGTLRENLLRRERKSAAVLRGLIKSFTPTWRRDPWMRGLDRIVSELHTRGVQGTVFLKAGGRAAEDSGCPVDDRNLLGIAQNAMHAGCEIGLHPSYFAYANVEMVDGELAELRRCCGRDAGRSVRQHYLRYDLGVTPLVHEACGFQIDSTLGFAEREGFRRGTCLPFRVFDVASGRPTKVWEVPLTFMDATLFNYRTMRPDKAVERSVALMETCRSFGGACVGLWHNTIFDEPDYAGWDTHFLQTIDAAVEREALVASLTDALASWHAGPENHG